MENINVSDVQKFFETGTGNYVVHGSVSTCVDDILKDGLLIRSTDFPTVVSTDGGRIAHDNTLITEYEWCEPRSEGENVAIIINVPLDVIQTIQQKGLKVTQKNIFDIICKEIELKVPDTEQTRNVYQQALIQSQNQIASKLDAFEFESLQGPKFSQLRTKPGTKYTHLGIPPEYIFAITSKHNVYYANDQIKEFVQNNLHNNSNNNIAQNDNTNPSTQEEYTIDSKYLF